MNAVKRQQPGAAFIPIGRRCRTLQGFGSKGGLLQFYFTCVSKQQGCSSTFVAALAVCAGKCQRATPPSLCESAARRLCRQTLHAFQQPPRPACPLQSST